MTSNQEFFDWWMMQSKIPFMNMLEIAEKAWDASAEKNEIEFKKLQDEIVRLHIRCDGYQTSRDWAIEKLAGALELEPDLTKAVEYYARLAAEKIAKLDNHAKVVEEVEKLEKEIARVKESEGWAWKNVRSIEAARVEEMGKRDAAQAEVEKLRADLHREQFANWANGK